MLPAYVGDDVVDTHRRQEIVAPAPASPPIARVQDGGEAVPLAWRLQRGQHAGAGRIDRSTKTGCSATPCWTSTSNCASLRTSRPSPCSVALRFNLEAENQEVIDEIATALRTLPNRTIAEVRAMRLPPSELETMMHVGNSGGFNPYSRLPVHEQAMFFGRSRELEQCAEWLRAGSGNIWLIGQKRVGKTSLLLYLKRHYLNNQGYVPAFVDFQLLGNLAEGNLFYEIANAVYTDLQTDPRVAALDAPLRALFDHQPPAQFIAYLRSIQSRLGANRLVLLLDEFSRTTDAHLQGQLDPNFFDAWRGVLQAILPRICFITVVQQQTYDALSQRPAPVRRPELASDGSGRKLVLKSLDDEDVRRLIEWPMRNFVEFSPESVAAMWQASPAATRSLSKPLLQTGFAHGAPGSSPWSGRISTRCAWTSCSPASVFAYFLDMIRQRRAGVAATGAAACGAERRRRSHRRRSPLCRTCR